jgi:hypothetical protein
VQILINHLTRMQSGFICTAGIDLATNRHIRPVVRGVGLSTSLLAAEGGPFAIAAVVDLGPTKYVGRIPELEDYRFDARKARCIRQTSWDEFWELLTRIAKPSLSEIFGPELTRRGPLSCATDLGKGSASLGCLIPQPAPCLSLQSRPGRPAQIRMRVGDGNFDLDLSVTDIRLYGPDHLTPDMAVLERIAVRLQASPRVVLSVGLGRPFAGSSSLPPVHWLQVNNIHFPDNLVW